jgi:hypothetical protein
VTKSNSPKNSLKVPGRYRYLEKGNVKLTVDGLGCKKSVGGSVLADFWSRVKYMNLRLKGHVNQQYTTVWRGNAVRVLDCGSHANIHNSASSRLIAGRGLLTPLISFFLTSPRLRVEILPRSLAPSEFVATYPFVGTLPEILGQALSIKAERNNIERLRAKAWLDQEGPIYLSWSRPPTSHWGLAIFQEPVEGAESLAINFVSEAWVR